MEVHLQRFLTIFNQLNSEQLQLLDDIYSADIQFTDPAHQIVGLPALKHYFHVLYQRLEFCRFDFDPPFLNGADAHVHWRMHLQHPRLNKGRRFSVDGVSLLQFNLQGLVCRQRDYFDLGALLYERLPLLGSVTRRLKRQLGR